MHDMAVMLARNHRLHTRQVVFAIMHKASQEQDDVLAMSAGAVRLTMAAAVP